MKFKSGIFLLIIIIFSAFSLSAQTNPEIESRQWPGFRGQYANGLSLDSSTPISWDVESATNIKWKIEIPGLSHSSPIVWDDRLYITAAVSKAENPELKVGLYGSIAPVEDESVHEWKLYCIDKNTGEIIWERIACTGIPKMKRHPKSTHANSTPVTDGNYVVAFFASEGLYCYDMSGNLIWKKDFGILDSGFFQVKEAQWGFAGSPIIHNGVVIIQSDVQENSFLAALDVKTGNEIWRTTREDVPTWSTPTVFTKNQRTQIIVNGFRHAGGYDFETGKEIWKITDGGDIPVPTPIIAHDLIFINSAHGKKSPIYAVKTDAKGDISLKEDETANDNIVWSINRGGSYLVTSIVYGDYFYNCRINGTLMCFNAKTGEQLYRERLGSGVTGFSASPVASNGKLYYTSEEGSVYVIKPGAEFELIAENSMNDICMATPAVSENTLFFRTHHYLIAISEDGR
ncbi:MAG: PQQ-binding-like beta-propeller repeat protein [bacterium]|nr:PQQ-binding-like beta-propeller repeat protein [bacterium]